MENRAQYVARRRRELEAERRNAESEDLVSRGLRGLDQNPAAKIVAGDLAGRLGQPLGAARGLVHDFQAIADGVSLAGGLITSNPNAYRAVSDAAHDAADYVRSRRSDPSLLLGDVLRTGAQWNRDLNPSATPAGASVSDEFGRRFGIGMNQGEALYHVGTTLLPVAGEIKGAAELALLGKGPAKYIKMGATPEQAAYLAQRDFVTMGHHSIAPRRAKMVRQVPVVQDAAQRLGAPQLPQKVFGDARVPQAFVDSPFNVVSPVGVERGQFYRQHYGLDDSYHGGRVSAEFGGGGWSGRKLGWTRYGPVERVLYGTPPATRAAIAAPPTAFGALGSISPNNQRGW